MLKEMPAMPSSNKPTPLDVYEKNLSMFKSAIYENNFGTVEYYILKASISAEDFFYIKFKIPLSEVWKFVIKAVLEK